MSNLSSIYDNNSRGKVYEFIKDSINKDSVLSIVSAYFTIYAFESIKKELLEVKKLRFLFGEPKFISALDSEKNLSKVFQLIDDNIQLSQTLSQSAIAKECAEWIKEKVQIRSIRETNLLHGKMYHFKSKEGLEKAILGSSNFTVNGLGFGSKANIELNLEIQDKRDIQDLLMWFDELWKDSKLTVDIKDKVLLLLEEIYKNHSPEFIYYKTLYHIFKKFIEEQENEGLLPLTKQIEETKIWKMLFNFQKQGVIGAINRIKNYNGCIIADSVGLGKTFEALAVIKYFELKNDKVLVLCPKKLRENWTIYNNENESLNPLKEDRLRFQVLSHTDLTREKGKVGDINLETQEFGNYDLIVIDESHNFRNATKSKRNEKGEIERFSRYEKLMENFLKKGQKTKVLLLSATPVNNDLKDLMNQIYFFTEGDDNAFKETIRISSIKNTIASAQRSFSEWAREENKNKNDLLDKLESKFFKLLDTLTISRSRKHIQKFFDLKDVGEFPIRLKPLTVTSDVDTKGRIISFDKLNEEIEKYNLTIFKPSTYVKPEFEEIYTSKERIKNFSQAKRENYLVGMMKVNFLKRLESSVFSFAQTLERTIEKIETLIEKIENFENLNEETELPDLDLYEEESENDELQDAFEVGKKYKYKLKHLDLEKWKIELTQDKQQLNSIFAQVAQITSERDAKLQKLKELIKNKIQNPTINKKNNQNRKVIVFTAFADTANYLYQSLENWVRKDFGLHIALVSGSASNKSTFGITDFNKILTYFSPISKNRNLVKSYEQDEEIDILIATDCISEGQNLQDCDYLINYDIHWNPVRIIQRFGRIDRIGSLNKSVQLVNFWLTDDLNKYLDLRGRVEARMALVDVTTTGEDDILNVEQQIRNDLKYRDRQLLKLKEEVLDLEDIDENINFSDFSLDDFRMDLLNYIRANEKLLKDAPIGLYAVVPENKEMNITKGVIFCLKQTNESEENEVVNPLQPHFLVYVKEDGSVRLTFLQAKKILDFCKLLCDGKDKPYEELCRLFDSETENGKKMEKYSELLKSSVSDITKRYFKKIENDLFLTGDFVIPETENQINQSSDFQLVTWLVIK